MLRMASIEKRYCNLPLARVAMDECAVTVPSGWCGAGVIADATADEAGWLEAGLAFCPVYLPIIHVGIERRGGNLCMKYF